MKRLARDSRQVSSPCFSSLTFAFFKIIRLEVRPLQRSPCGSGTKAMKKRLGAFRYFPDLRNGVRLANPESRNPSSNSNSSLNSCSAASMSRHGDTASTSSGSNSHSYFSSELLKTVR